MVTLPQAWPGTAYIAGDPALDFLNTVDNHDKARDGDLLAGWDAFLGWARGARGLFEAAELAALGRIGRDPVDAARRLDALRDLRETAHRVLAPLARNAEVDPAARAALEAPIRTAVARAELILVPGEARWRVQPQGPEWPGDALALALERLLRRPDLGRLRECGRCSWLFLDHGRGRGRSWCDMRTCGNRAKAARHRRR